MRHETNTQGLVIGLIRFNLKKRAGDKPVTTFLIVNLGTLSYKRYRETYKYKWMLARALQALSSILTAWGEYSVFHKKNTVRYSYA